MNNSNEYDIIFPSIKASKSSSLSDISEPIKSSSLSLYSNLKNNIISKSKDTKTPDISKPTNKKQRPNSPAKTTSSNITTSLNLAPISTPNLFNFIADEKTGALKISWKEFMLPPSILLMPANQRKMNLTQSTLNTTTNTNTTAVQSKPSSARNIDKEDDPNLPKIITRNRHGKIHYKKLLDDCKSDDELLTSEDDSNDSNYSKSQESIINSLSTTIIIDESILNDMISRNQRDSNNSSPVAVPSIASLSPLNNNNKKKKIVRFGDNNEIEIENNINCIDSTNEKIKIDEENINEDMKMQSFSKKKLSPKEKPNVLTHDVHVHVPPAYGSTLTLSNTSIQQSKLSLTLISLIYISILILSLPCNSWLETRLNDLYVSNNAAFAQPNIYLNPYLTETEHDYYQNEILNDFKKTSDKDFSITNDETFYAYYNVPRKIYGSGKTSENNNNKNNIRVIDMAERSTGRKDESFIKALFDLDITQPKYNAISNDTWLVLTAYGMALETYNLKPPVSADPARMKRTLEIEVLMDETRLQLPQHVFDFEISSRIDMRVDLATYNITVGAHNVRVSVLLVCNPEFDAHSYKYLTVSSETLFYYFPPSPPSPIDKSNNIPANVKTSENPNKPAKVTQTQKPKEKSPSSNIPPVFNEQPLKAPSADVKIQSKKDEKINFGEILSNRDFSHVNIQRNERKEKERENSNVKDNVYRNTEVFRDFDIKEPGVPLVPAVPDHVLPLPTVLNEQDKEKEKDKDVQREYISPFHYLSSNMESITSGNSFPNIEYKEPPIIKIIEPVPPGGEGEGDKMQFIPFNGNKFNIKVVFPKNYLLSSHLFIELVFDGKAYDMTRLVRDQFPGFGGNKLTDMDLRAFSVSSMLMRDNFNVVMEGVELGEHTIVIVLYGLNSSKQTRLKMGEDSINIKRV